LKLAAFAFATGALLSKRWIVPVPVATQVVIVLIHCILIALLVEALNLIEITRLKEINHALKKAMNLHGCLIAERGPDKSATAVAGG
jgi:predicted small secreted protein